MGCVTALTMNYALLIHNLNHGQGYPCYGAAGSSKECLRVCRSQASERESLDHHHHRAMHPKPQSRRPILTMCAPSPFSPIRRRDNIVRSSVPEQSPWRTALVPTKPPRLWDLPSSRPQSPSIELSPALGLQDSRVRHPLRVDPQVRASPADPAQKRTPSQSRFRRAR